MSMRTTVLISGFGFLMLACAGTEKPTDKLVAAQAAVRAAEESGAARIPEAQLHNKLAFEQVQKAQRLIEDGDNEEAGRVLTRAEADAELALSMTRKSRASRELMRNGLGPDLPSSTYAPTQSR